ncbi:hypothetical protein EB796_022791 [Bugula neritina]|uniref:RRM domain-containing protein n=1 Tax=Bugula neritina TaxID=10212 RepID=A0A7J7IZD6_BUGNE|nr:hypothetical protein EB796_022791 [Bugula neritina]
MNTGGIPNKHFMDNVPPSSFNGLQLNTPHNIPRHLAPNNSIRPQYDNRVFPGCPPEPPNWDKNLNIAPQAPLINSSQQPASVVPVTDPCASITNLPTHVAYKQLRGLFATHNIFAEDIVINWPPKESNETASAVVKFDDINNTVTALNELKGMKISGLFIVIEPCSLDNYKRAASEAALKKQHGLQTEHVIEGALPHCQEVFSCEIDLLGEAIDHLTGAALLEGDLLIEIRHFQGNYPSRAAAFKGITTSKEFPIQGTTTSKGVALFKGTTSFKGTTIFKGATPFKGTTSFKRAAIFEK